MRRTDNQSIFRTLNPASKNGAFCWLSATQFRGVYLYTLPAGALLRLVSNAQSIAELHLAHAASLFPSDISRECQLRFDCAQ
jgi:hypothetical protein